MSELVIKDGTGQGYRTKVDSANRMHVSATTVSAPANATDKGFTYIVSSLSRTLNAIDTNHAIIWLNVTDTARHFHISRITISWNGGSTNWNRPLLATFQVNSGTPSANHTAYTPVNANGLSSLSAGMGAYIWDGVGNGMTIAGAIDFFSGWFSPGTKVLNFAGEFILAPLQAISIAFQSPEIGKASLYISGWFENNSTNLVQ